MFFLLLNDASFAQFDLQYIYALENDFAGGVLLRFRQYASIFSLTG